MTIRAIAAGGDGVATLDSGKTVFVPRTAPGDVAQIEVTDERARWARGRVVRLEEASPDRVDPKCPHYEGDACGGCQLQHLSPEAQLRAKRQIVGDAIRRIGGFGTQDDPPIAAAPNAWRYRSRVTLAGQDARIGYHRHDAPGEVFDLVDCHIASPHLMDLWAALSVQRNLLPERVRSLVLREDQQGRRHVVVERSEAEPWEATALATAVDRSDVAYWWRTASGPARSAGGAIAEFPVTAFEQIQPEFGERIRHTAVEALGNVAGRVVWDLYAGMGAAAAQLAGAGGVVHAVESDRAAVAAGREQTQGVGPGSVTWHRSRVEDRLEQLPVPYAVLVNPPRTGLAAPVTAYLARWAEATTAARLVYVSCDPATLARDLKRMPGLRVEAVTAYDLFPQTAHVETVVALEVA